MGGLTHTKVDLDTVLSPRQFFRLCLLSITFTITCSPICWLVCPSKPWLVFSCSSSRSKLSSTFVCYLLKGVGGSRILNMTFPLKFPTKKIPQKFSSKLIFHLFKHFPDFISFYHLIPDQIAALPPPSIDDALLGNVDRLRDRATLAVNTDLQVYLKRSLNLGSPFSDIMQNQLKNKND